MLSSPSESSSVMPADGQDVEAQRLAHTVEVLARLGQAIDQVSDTGPRLVPSLTNDDRAWLDQHLLQPLIGAPSEYLNQVCQTLLDGEVPYEAMSGLRFALDQSLMNLRHDGRTWGIFAVTGGLAFAPQAPMALVLDGLIDQADDLSTAWLGEPGRVRFAVQYFTSSTGFPYPDTQTLSVALSSMGMLLQNPESLATYNALAADGESEHDLEMPLEFTHAMLLMAVCLEGLPSEVERAVVSGERPLAQRWEIPYRLGEQSHTVTFTDAHLTTVFSAQAALSCRDDLVRLERFAQTQLERLVGSWDGVVAFVYPSHTLSETEGEVVDVHHLCTVNVVLWAEHLDMLIGAHSTRMLPGPAVMRLMGSFSGLMTGLGVPSVEFFPPQPLGQDTNVFLTPKGWQNAG